MKRFLLFVTAAAALAIPAAAVAAAPPTAGSLATQSCKAQQAQLGAATFKSTYGANAYGKCVAIKAKATVQLLTQKTVAGAKACKAELTLKGKAAFTTTYGAKANAFGVCVSRKLAA